jgi:hypothetical protein
VIRCLHEWLWPDPLSQLYQCGLGVRQQQSRR